MYSELFSLLFGYEGLQEWYDCRSDTTTGVIRQLKSNLWGFQKSGSAKERRTNQVDVSASPSVSRNNLRVLLRDAVDSDFVPYSESFRAVRGVELQIFVSPQIGMAVLGYSLSALLVLTSEVLCLPFRISGGGWPCQSSLFNPSRVFMLAVLLVR